MQYSSILKRSSETYTEDPSLVSWILSDPCNPLNQIHSIIDHGIVLDIGCGSGILGKLLQNKSGIVIDGLDPSLPEGNFPHAYYRKTYQTNIEDFIAKNDLAQYDWFILADVIEHLPYPDEILHLLSDHAKPNARFLISTPNIAHFSIRLSLMRGYFQYTKSGILESTHLRFFTFKTLNEILFSAKLNITKAFILNQFTFPSKISFRYAWENILLAITNRNDQYLTAYQFLIFAQKNTITSEINSHQVGDHGSKALIYRLTKQLIINLKSSIRKLF
ncbi:MAG TPA: class I SAM-dependent methyltransferase [Candidatus Thiothrix moscowensis]|uniref:class I SAM-dependent methyltransferase n=1 Tax=unclassified Thiothrix TaxID=2636184 RepID=UPI0026001883|nr:MULTISPECIES: class I SAM-dependent methyltransferase [unclassified Thiothrix]HRJ54154.1 class I SAM-dependent methyltransferase [Candidatus Thiothrix moscowensis]HRJ94354.1 class I SAM-dependent methyltransferase [Candidatus Thiothrix moscowensis]